MSKDHTSFLNWLAHWEEGLPSVDLGIIASDPARVAVVSVDMVKGFCSQGPLSSPRVANIVPAVVGLFQRAHDLGVRHFLLTQDAHEPDSVEFSAFPAHCVAGTTESETINELDDLTFSSLFTVIPKRSISSNIGTGLAPWLDAHPAVTAWVVVGNCTDLCVYQAAMYLRLRANTLGLQDTRVLIPVDCVQTYDMAVETAEELGALPHAGNLLHRIFLYHMALNGIEIVAHLA